MKKILFFLALILATAQSHAFFNCYPTTTTPCYSTEYERGAPPAKRCIPKCRWYLFADVLVWYVTEDGFDYGPAVFTEVIDDDGELTTELVTETVKHPSFGWEPGIRVGFGRDHVWNSWDFEAYWTHINANARGRINKSNKQHWHLHYNTVDAIFTRTFRDRVFIFEPFWGVRAAFIQQRQHLHAFDKLITLQNEEFPIKVNQKSSQYFRSVGPEIGFRTAFDFCGCYSVYGEVAGTALFGKFALECKESDKVSIWQQCRKCSRNPRYCQFTLDIGAGVDWKPCLCQQWMDLLLTARYEYHRYFNHNYIGCKGDLILQGFVFSANVTF